MSDKYIYIGYIQFFNRKNFSPINKVSICRIKIIDEVYYKGSKQYQLEESFILPPSIHIRYLVERDLDKAQTVLDVEDSYLAFYFSFNEDSVRKFMDDKINLLKKQYLKKINTYNNRYETLCDTDYLIVEDWE